MKEERREKTREDERKEERGQEERRQDNKREEKREDKKREEARQEKRQDEEREMKRGEFFSKKKNVSETSNPPDELAQKCFEKKIPVRRILPPFFSAKVQNLAVFELFT